MEARNSSTTKSYAIVAVPSREYMMARLTPKIDSNSALRYFSDIERGEQPKMKVCNYLGTIGRRSTMPMLRQSIEAHDLITQISLKNTSLF